MIAAFFVFCVWAFVGAMVFGSGDSHELRQKSPEQLITLIVVCGPIVWGAKFITWAFS